MKLALSGLIGLLHNSQILKNLCSLKSHLCFTHGGLRLADWLVQHLVLHAWLQQLGLLFEHVHQHRHVRLLCILRGSLRHWLWLVHDHVHLSGDLRSLRRTDVHRHLSLAWSHVDGLGRLCSDNLPHSYVVLPSCWFAHLNVLRHDTLADWCLHLNLVRLHDDWLLCCSSLGSTVDHRQERWTLTSWLHSTRLVRSLNNGIVLCDM